jgi:CheY-like chemotaxis protein
VDLFTENKNFGAVIMDIKMPVMDGITATNVGLCLSPSPSSLSPVPPPSIRKIIVIF